MMSCKERGDTLLQWLHTRKLGSPTPRNGSLHLPVRTAWARARGSMGEVRRYIWGTGRKGGDRSKSALPSTDSHSTPSLKLTSLCYDSPGTPSSFYCSSYEAH